MRSLRSRIIFGTLVGMTVVLAATGWGIHSRVRSWMRDDLDRDLVTAVESSERAIESGLRPPRGIGGRRPGARRRPPRRTLRSDFQDPPFWSGRLVQAWRVDSGQVIGRSETLGDDALPRLATNDDRATLHTIALPDGSEGRAASRRFRLRRDRRRPRSPLEATSNADELGPLIDVVVAQSTADMRAKLARLGWLLVVAWGTACLGCGLVLFWVAHMGLAPLRRLGQQIESIDEERLDSTFHLERSPSELVPVVGRLNGLMERMGRAFEREQAFTSDAAHELRTPLAGLRSTLELALSRPRSTEEYAGSARRCLEITEQMQAMVNDLLDLARRGETVLDRRPVVIADLLSSCWNPLKTLARDRRVSLDVEGDPEARVESDRALLDRIITNLLENAATYGDEGTTIEVTVGGADRETLSIAVSNVVSSAPADIAERALEPFWRADAARSDVRHLGLGLALCNKLAVTLGGRLDAAYDAPRFTITLHLPAASPAEQIPGKAPV